MANFTWEIKRDLLASLPEDGASASAMLSALLATGGSAYEGPRIEFVSENERVAEYFLALSEMAFGVRFEVKEAFLDPKRERDRLIFSCSGYTAARIVKETGFWKRSRRIVENEKLALAYLKGAFLGGGSCTLPRGGAKTGYHLEFVFPTRVLADALCELLDNLVLFGRSVRRGEKYVVYMKSRESISDLLSVIGATSALKTFTAVSAAREASGYENRVENCIAGNADKAAIASAAQVLALKELEESGALVGLTEQLCQTAKARIENPSLSLSELAEKLQISKSCLNHRLRKLMQIHEGKKL